LVKADSWTVSLAMIAERPSVTTLTAVKWLCLVLCLRGVAGCGPPDMTSSVRKGNATAAFADIESKVAAFCGDCHAVPSPSSFPRHAWGDEVELGFRFYIESGRTDLDVPPMNEVIRYYQARAPEELVLTIPDEAIEGAGICFERTEIPFPHSSPILPAVSHLRWIPSRGDDKPQLVFCDMNAGEVRGLALDGSNLTCWRQCPIRTTSNHVIWTAMVWRTLWWQIWEVLRLKTMTEDGWCGCAVARRTTDRPLYFWRVLGALQMSNQPISTKTTIWI